MLVVAGQHWLHLLEADVPINLDFRDWKLRRPVRGELGSVLCSPVHSGTGWIFLPRRYVEVPQPQNVRLLGNGVVADTIKIQIKMRSSWIRCASNSIWLLSSDQASLVAQTVKCLPTMQETQVRSLGQEDPLEKEMATHSSILAWKIPWMEEPGGLQSMGLQKVGHDWATSLHCPQKSRKDSCRMKNGSRD